MAMFQGLRGRIGSWFGYSTPYSAPRGYDTGKTWDPQLRSTDGDVLGARPYIEARIKDLVQRDGFLAGAIDTHVNHVVGKGLLLSAMPDWEALGLSEEWANNFADRVEGMFDTFVGSSRNWADAGRKHNWAALCAQAWKSFLIHGDIMAVPKFRKNQKWNSSVMIIDPNRVFTPVVRSGTMESNIKSGIEVDENGAVVRYFVHKWNPLEAAISSQHAHNAFTEVTPFGRTGRKRFIHHFDPVGTEQTRGISLFAPSVESVKRQGDLSDAMQKAAIYQSLIAAVIKSELNVEQAMAIVGAGQGKNAAFRDGLMAYMSDHGEYYQNLAVKLDGVKVHHLLPNEDLELKSAGVSGEYPEFAKTINREAARGTSLTLEQYTGDYGGLSYSGGQLSAGETDRGHQGRFMRVMVPFAQDVYELFLEEACIKHPDLLPDGVSFYDVRDEICKASWMGPPPVVGDPVKQSKATETDLINRVTTLEVEGSKRGLDWRKMLKQQKREQDFMDKLGLKNMRLEEIEMQQSELESDDKPGDGK